MLSEVEEVPVPPPAAFLASASRPANANNVNVVKSDAKDNKENARRSVRPGPSRAWLQEWRRAAGSFEPVDDNGPGLRSCH
jgi:hypothetical protein